MVGDNPALSGYEYVCRVPSDLRLLQACDEEGKGFLTAEDMERLLERVVGPGQQSREILAILGCGESSTTVTWQQFRQNIAQFLGDKENLTPGNHRESPTRHTVNVSYALHHKDC